LTRFLLACLFCLSLAYGLFQGLLYPPQALLHYHDPLGAKNLRLDRSLLLQALQGDNDAIEFCLRKLLRILDYPKDHFKVSLSDIKTDPDNHLSNHLSSKVKLKRNHKPLVITQSHATASITLALAEPHQILALPSSLRHQLAYHDEFKIKQVVTNVDHSTIEQLQNINPDICFASAFSDVLLLEKLKKIGCQTIVIPNADSFDSLWSNILSVGSWMSQSPKAMRLAALCQLCKEWLDSELKTLKLRKTDIVVLELYRYLNIPSTRQLYISWLQQQAPFKLLNPPITDWSKPIEYEDLQTMKPHFVIILADPSSSQTLERDKKWQRFIQKNSSHFSFLPNYCLHSPSQLMILGLYDLVASLKEFERIYNEP
jgi:ABC-type Fe3+-hydroxamate transport system substrate-binding protein